MKESLNQPLPEVDLNPHSDLPAAGVISAEISEPAGDQNGFSFVINDYAPIPLPFGVYFGKQAAPSENRTPQT